MELSKAITIPAPESIRDFRGSRSDFGLFGILIFLDLDQGQGLDPRVSLRWILNWENANETQDYQN